MDHKKRLSIEKRKQYILSLLDKQGSVTVSELSECFQMSDVSIRKLLITMENEALLQRTWGGATKLTRATNELSYPVRETRNLSEKIAIAKVAYDCIEEGDAVYLDSGTTTLELAKLIAQGNKQNLLIATNALDHARELQARADLNVIMVGGEIRPDVRACSGYITNDVIRQLIFDKGFIGVEHISPEHSFTTPNKLDAELKRIIIQASKQNYILADYSKFWNDSLVQIVPLQQIYRVITDWHMPDTERTIFTEKGVDIVSAPAPALF